MSVDLKDLETTPTLSLDPSERLRKSRKFRQLPLRRQSNRLLMRAF